MVLTRLPSNHTLVPDYKVQFKSGFDSSLQTLHAMEDTEYPYTKLCSDFQFSRIYKEIEKLSCKYITTTSSSSLSPKEKEIDVQSVLRLMGIRFPHRAYVIIASQDVESIEQLVWNRFCFQYADVRSLHSFLNIQEITEGVHLLGSCVLRSMRYTELYWVPSCQQCV